MARIDEIKKRLAATTKGQWYNVYYPTNHAIQDHNDYGPYDVLDENYTPQALDNATFIVNAKNSYVPYLLAEVERYKAVVGVAKRLLDGLHDEPDWEGFGPTNVVRYDDVVSLKTALAELEAEK